MGKALICAEKPSQAKALAAPFPNKNMKTHIAIAPCVMFPEGAVVIWAVGHILELFGPEDYSKEYQEWSLDNLPIIPKEYKLKVIESKRSIFNNFKKFLKDPDISVIIHAADPGIEGCLLLDEIFFYLNNRKPVKRLWTSSLTKDSVVDAFRSMKDNRHYQHYYYAGIARQRADWLVGMSSSRALTCLLNQKGIEKTFSAGRVQTALMSIIYQREKEIENFTSKPYFDLIGEFRFGDAKLNAKWFSNESEHIFDMDEDMLEAFSKYCQSQSAIVNTIKREEKKKRPPMFYNLSSLQMHANRLYGMTPANVLGFAQALYDKSIITYPRSDSHHLTPGEAAWMPVILKNLGELENYQDLTKGATRDISQDSRYVDSEKVSDHYAIILTEEKVNPLTLPKGEQQIYDLIAKSIIAAHYPDYIYDTNGIIIRVAEKFGFRSSGTLVKEEGWKKLYKGLSTNLAEEEIQLPDIKEGEVGTMLSGQIKAGSTNPPSRFSLGDLIKIMCNPAPYCAEQEDFKNSELQLGTEATRSGIVSILTKRYVTVRENLVYMLPEGRVLIEALGENNYLTSVLTSGKMERYLKQIQKGEGSVTSFVKRTEVITKEIVEKLIKDAATWNFVEYAKDIQKAEEVGPCKNCGAPVLDRESFYGCSNFKKANCDFRISKVVAGKPISKENIKKLLTTGQTSLIKGFKSQKKPDKMFEAFLAWDEDKNKLVFKFQQ